MRSYFSTRAPVSGFTQASGNSEQWKMMGNEDNVGFLAAGSGVQQFQLSSWGCFVREHLRCSRELRSTRHTSSLRLRLLSPTKPVVSIHRIRIEAHPHRAWRKVSFDSAPLPLRQREESHPYSLQERGCKLKNIMSHL